MTKRKTALSARERANAEIVAVARDGLAAYYEAHPDRLGDARSQDAISVSTAGIGAVLAVLERYEISDAATPADLGRVRKQAYTGVLDALRERFAVFVNNQANGESLTSSQVDWASAQTTLVGKEILAVLDSYEIGLRTKPRNGKKP